ncbi:MAG: hypothetical protein BWY09_01819 [Candidatus Hydrogenedentes bacterium ADurb.Bin179]|nr:MAG: hypothetical protein BWY09_01819 [Candidatus Hydrogenedentes bacterium ADurb.Bin179]
MIITTSRDAGAPSNTIQRELRRKYLFFRAGIDCFNVMGFHDGKVSQAILCTDEVAVSLNGVFCFPLFFDRIDFPSISEGAMWCRLLAYRAILYYNNI